MRSRLALCLALAGCSTPEPVPTPRASEPEPPVVAEPDPKPTPAADPDLPPCLLRFEFDANGSVLHEQRTRGGAQRWDDFASSYPAVYLDPDADHPVEAVTEFRIGDTPLLWFTADFAQAVVNAAVLSELKVVNATTLGVGERVQLGSLSELGQGKISGRALTHFLMRADVIQTYVHIGSTVCLLSEHEQDGDYQAQLSGEHVYFTNTENHDAFGFLLDLGADGAITITGAQPQPFAAGEP